MTDIPRQVFMDTLQNSPNLPYVLEINGFKKSKAPNVNLFEVMKRLDVFDIVKLLRAVDNPYADVVKEYYIHQYSSGIGVSGDFDCYLPFDQKRDYIIKQILKGNKPPNPLEGFGEIATGVVFRTMPVYHEHVDTPTVPSRTDWYEVWLDNQHEIFKRTRDENGNARTGGNAIKPDQVSVNEDVQTNWTSRLQTMARRLTLQLSSWVRALFPL